MEKIYLGKAKIHFDDLNFEIRLNSISLILPYSDWERINRQYEIIAEFTNGELDGHYTVKKEE